MIKISATRCVLTTGALLVAAVGCWTSESNAPAVQNDQPHSLTFESRVVDIGEIEEGLKGQAVFVFRNTGDSSVIVEETKTSCACTLAEKPEAPIAPQNSGSITAVITTIGKQGPGSQRITVICRAGNVAYEENLEIKYTVIPATRLTMEPSGVSLHNVQKGATFSREITVNLHAAAKEPQLRAVTLPAGARLDVLASHAAAKMHTWKLRLSGTAPVDVGPFHEELRVQVSAEQLGSAREISASVSGRVNGDAALDPPSITKIIDGSESSTLTEIKGTSQRKSRIQFVSITVTGSAALKPVVALLDDGAKCTISPPATMSPGSVCRGEVQLEVSLPDVNVTEQHRIPYVFVRKSETSDK